MNLFSSMPEVLDEFESRELESMKLNLPDADVEYFPDFFTKEESDRFYKSLLKNTPWQQDSIKFYGKEIPLPRLTAWFGAEDMDYSYSGIQMKPHPWTDELLEIKFRVEEIACVDFTSVLLNLYRTGSDGVSWHADDEKELGANPVIGSVSFGATRSFQLKNKENPELKAKLELEHGSFLLMQGETQHHWLHQVPKTSKDVQPRINLTFRIIQ